MDSKSGTQMDNNGIETNDNLSKLQLKSKATDANPVSKQRVIKQIVSLDSKKLKALGIESTILSALTKFNGKEKSLIKTKPVASMHDVVESSSSKQTLTKIVHPNESELQKTSLNYAKTILVPDTVITSQNISTFNNKVPDKNSTKKIEVLSNVLLNENKLDLKRISAISTPVDSKHVPYVSPVQRPSQIKRIVDNVIQCPPSTSVAIHSEKIISPEKMIFPSSQSLKKSPEKMNINVMEKTYENLPMKHDKKSHEHLIDEKLSIKLDEKSPEMSTIKMTKNSLVESTQKLHLQTSVSLRKTFEKSPDKSSSKLAEKTPIKSPTKDPIESATVKNSTDLQSKSSDLKSETIDDVDVLKGFSLLELKRSQDQFEHLQLKMCTNDPADSTECETVEAVQTKHSDLSNSFGTLEMISSSESDSDSESDLDELIKEAQLTIENEQAVKNSCEMTESSEHIMTKNPCIVENSLLHEHMDKDRLIDEFLFSTINSFRTEYDSTSNSDSGDERDNLDSSIDTENDAIKPEENSLKTNDEIITNDISDTPTKEKIQIEPIMEEPQVERTLTTDLTQNDEPKVVEKIQQARRTRKSSLKSEIKTKRKKSQSSNDKIVSVQIQEAVKIVKSSAAEPVKVNQEESNSIDAPNNVIAPEQAVAVNHPIPKRGRKPKQTILNDYFSVQNAILNATKQSLDELVSKVNATKEPAKRSSFGRAIKPKSFDIESVTTVKRERKTRIESINEPKSQDAIIKVKTNSIAPKPLKKRGRDKMYEYMIPHIDIPSTGNIVEPSDSYSEQNQFVSSTPVVETTRGRRKSAKQINVPTVDTIPQEFIEENLSMDLDENEINIIDTDKELPSRRYTTSRKSIASTISQQTVTLDSNIIMDSQDVPQTADDINEVQVEPKKTVPKKRGRNLKTPIIKSNETITDNLIDFTPIQNEPTNVEVEFAAVPEPAEITSPVKKQKGPGRRSKGEVANSEESPFVPEATDENGQPTKFICGNCQNEVPISKWKAHEATHFGVTFRVGIDDPIDIEDPSVMSRLIIRFMKLNKVHYLKCSKCGTKKKSAVGYISHVEVCGLTTEEAKSIKAECEYCKKLYRKVSLASHQQSFCPVRRLELAQQQADLLLKSTAEDGQQVAVVYTESGRPKRMIKKVQRKITKNVDDFIKVGSKITGGTFKSWSNQLREENIIRCSNENCDYTITDLKLMREHFQQCRDSILQCRICHYTERSRDEIVQHIETVHADEFKMLESDDENNDDNDYDYKTGYQSSSSSDGESDEYTENERSEKGKARPRRAHIIPLKQILEDNCPAYWEMLSAFYTRILDPRPQPSFYRKTYQWTQEFIEHNYDLDVLALKGHLRNTVEIVRLPQREMNKFLDLLHSKSPKFLCKKQKNYSLEKCLISDELTWSNLQLFESVQSTHAKFESSIIFCGGKVITVDWIPFPANYNGNQILVICSQPHNVMPLNLTNCIPMEKCKSLIQLWSVSTNANEGVNKTEFMYGIAYEDGPIFSISFCPSDAYVASKRLAIVAVPDTNGNINIISIPDNVSKAKTNTSTVIKLKPDVRLQLGFKIEENTPKTITQMTWSRYKGHKVLCASYNTGLIAIWNFDHLNSTYMTQKCNGIPILLPYHTFIGALSFITQLDMHADQDGNIRWILVGALDRRIKMYDLQDPQLIPFTSPIFKSRIISGIWPLHWPIYLSLIDASLTQQSGGLQIKPILYTNNQPTSTNLSNECEPSNLAFSDWLNTAIFGNEVGDLFMINFQQLLLYDRYSESSEPKILSSTDVFIDEQSVNNEAEQPTVDTSNISDRISIVFNDFDDAPRAPKMNTRIPTIEAFPFARITRVAINPLESHKKLYAIGYELGFCRIQLIPEI